MSSFFHPIYCFFHSLLRLLSPEYRKAKTSTAKKKIVRETRKNIGDSITYDVWLNIADGTLSKLRLAQVLEKVNRPKLAEKITSFGNDPLTDEFIDNIITPNEDIRKYLKRQLRKLYAEYIEYVTDCNVYVGNEVFNATANYFNANIFILDSDRKYIYRTCEFSETRARSVVLAYTGAIHYESVIAELDGNKILAFANDDRLIRWFRENCR